MAGARTQSLEQPSQDRRKETKRSDPAFPVVCYLTTDHPSTPRIKAYGTAVLIGPRFALTAGHNVYDPASFGTSIGGGYGRSVTVTPGYSVMGRSAGKTQSAQQVVCHERFIESGDIAYDLALLHFPAPHEHTTSFPALETAQTGASIRVIGYPVRVDPFAMREHESPVKALRAGRVFYAADATDGQSGGGVFLDGAAKLTLAGIHTYGHARTPADLEPANSATSLNGDTLNWVQSS